MQKLQMMGAEPRKEDQIMNIVLRSKITARDDEGRQTEEHGWIRKAPKKEVGFDLNRMKEKFMEAKKSFIEASTLGSHDKMQDISVSTEVDLSMLTTFFETCIKLLPDRRVLEGFKELIKKCTNKEKVLDGHSEVRDIGKNKVRTRCEMRITMKIRDYEMD